MFFFLRFWPWKIIYSDKSEDSFFFLLCLYSNKKSIDSLSWQQFIGLGVQVLLSSSQFQNASSSCVSTWLTSARTFYIRFEFPLFLLLLLECRHSFPLIRSDVQSSGRTNTLVIMWGKRVDDRNGTFFSLIFFIFATSINTRHTYHARHYLSYPSRALTRND